MKRRGRSRPRFIKPINTKCPYCEESKEPDYKEGDKMKQYMTDRGKIVGRARSGLCQKHQRRLATAIKRARHLALLPFVSARQ